MGEALLHPATYDDILALPDYKVGEVISGMLYAQPRPAPRHVRFSSGMGSELFGAFDRGRNGPGGWWILDKPELHLGQDVLVPDLAGWRRETMPTLPKTAWFEQAPDWVAEILSPSTARKDRALKMPKYAEYGVQHCWLIDPDVRTLEAFENRDGLWTLLGVWGEEDAVAVKPFDAVAIELAGLWVD